MLAADEFLKPRICGPVPAKSTWIPSPRTVRLTRTGVAMATVVGTVEKGTQIPLDGVNYVTDRASEKARETFRIDNMPEMRFHSRARGRRIGIVFQARW